MLIAYLVYPVLDKRRKEYENFRYFRIRYVLNPCQLECKDSIMYEIIIDKNLHRLFSVSSLHRELSRFVIPRFDPYFSLEQ